MSSGFPFPGTTVFMVAEYALLNSDLTTRIVIVLVIAAFYTVVQRIAYALPKKLFPKITFEEHIEEEFANRVNSMINALALSAFVGYSFYAYGWPPTMKERSSDIFD